MQSMTVIIRNVLLASALLGAGACAPATAPATDLHVFAAASLSAAFDALAAEFTKQEPAVRVVPSYGGSSGLATQIIQGAGADVFASADEPNMQKVVDASLAADPKIFALNRLEIVIAAGNPKHITALADLARPDVVVVLAAPAVPAGAYAEQALAKTGVTVVPKSLETDVKRVVAKVGLGEADAGIAYVTDVAAGGPKLAGVPIPDASNVVARYPIAVVRDSPHGAIAAAFVDFVRSDRGRGVLASFGFVLP